MKYTNLNGKTFVLMIRCYAAILLLCSLSVGYGQATVKAYVTAHTQPILSIDPANQDYADLQAIGDAIGDARIVMLGEQDHGDAPTFLAKTRLIQYLHEKKGFNVLAFESDFFGMNYDWPLVKQGLMTVEEYAQKDISPIWSYCNTCYPLLKTYVPHALTTSHPLELAGFDSQVGTQYLLPLLDSVLLHLKLPITTAPQYRSEIWPLLTTWFNYTKDTSTNDRIVGIYRQIKDQLLAKLGKDDFWVQTVDNLIAQNGQFRNWKKDYWKDMNTRDRQMAANLQWLAKAKYPAQKIIVWAHNYHVSKYSGHYPEDFMNHARTMGTVFTQDSTLMKQTYIIGFSSYQGTAGRLNRALYKLPKPKAKAFENWISPTYEYAFVDFKKYNQANPSVKEQFLMGGSIKGNGMHTSHEAAWNHIFDGVFFIRNMYPCERKANGSTN
jgi:erythromycin esterase